LRPNKLDHLLEENIKGVSLECGVYSNYLGDVLKGCDYKL